MLVLQGFTWSLRGFTWVITEGILEIRIAVDGKSADPLLLVLGFRATECVGFELRVWDCAACGFYGLGLGFRILGLVGFRFAGVEFRPLLVLSWGLFDDTTPATRCLAKYPGFPEVRDSYNVQSLAASRVS